MIVLKAGVRLRGLRPEVVMAALVVAGVYEKYGFSCTITSAVDGRHMDGSEHYTGLALDFRLNDLSGIPPRTRPMIAADVRAALGEDFDVIHEGAGTENEHLHIEFDPKRL